jgi:hypothetical protein
LPGTRIVISPSSSPGLITGFSGGNATGLLDTFNQQGIAGLTLSASPTSIIEYRFAVSRLGMDRLPMSVGGPSMRELFGITGLPEGPRIQGGVTPQDITGFAPHRTSIHQSASAVPDYAEFALQLLQEPRQPQPQNGA